jgi:energy-converting hydrogenase Eha subunit H
MKKTLVILAIILVFILGVIVGANKGMEYQESIDKPIIEEHLQTIANQETKIESLKAIIATVDNLGPACQVITITMDFLDQLKDVKKAEEH